MQPTNNKKIIAVLILALIIFGIVLFFLKKGKTAEAPAPVSTNQNFLPPLPSTQTPISSVPEKILPKPIPIPKGTDQFVVSPTATSEDLAGNLLDQEYIKDAATFSASIGLKPIAPGAYKISKGWTPSQLLQVLRGKPYMKWVVIPPGLRKEEIAVLLASALNWTTTQKKEWITKDTTTKP